VNGINARTGVQEPINYTFDHTFDPNCRQIDVYDTAVMPIIDSVLEGFNGTILAYGQTSSGKTHTMLGPDIDNEEQRGIIPRMVGGIFAKIETAPEEVEFTVKVSFIEIYNEKIRDLLNPKKNNLKVHESKDDGVYVGDMTESYVGGEDEVFSLLKVGNENRSIGATDMNAQSSRSHSCFIL
jgi:kinesin family protein 5